MKAIDNNAAPQDETAETEKYGIVGYPVYCFQSRQHKYAKLTDAIAQVARERSVF